MFSNNVKHNQFVFEIPQDWFIPKICEKYNKFLEYKNGIFTNIIDYVNESIQTVELGSFTQQPIEQQQRAGIGKQIHSTVDKNNQNELIQEKNITVTLRHSLGFINYYCLLEHFIYYHDRSTKNIYHKGFVLQTKDEHGNLIFLNQMHKVFMENIDILTYSYNTLENQFDTFNIVFSYNNFNLMFNLPKISDKIC